MNAAQKLVLVVIALAALAGGGFLFLGSSGESGDGGTVDFSADELEAVDEDLGDLIAPESNEEGAEGGAERVVLEDGGAQQRGAAAEGRVPLTVEGRVVLESGAPVAEAEVSLYLRRSLQALFRAGGRGPGARGRGDWRERFRLQKVAKTVTTGEDGRFAFSGPAFAASTVQVGVVHASFAPKVVQRDWEEKDGKLEFGDVVVAAGGLAFGRVATREGGPLQGAEVRYKQSNRGGRGRRGRGGFGTQSTIEELIPPVQTDASGQFELANLPAGNFELEVEATKHLPARSARFEMKPEAKVNVGSIVLDLGVELRGIVRDRQGKPVQAAEVEATLSFRGRRRGGRGRGGNPGEGTIRGPGDRPSGDRRSGDRGPGDRGRGGRGGDLRRMFGALMANPRKTKTNARGEFFLDAVPSSGVRLRVTHPKFIDEEQDPVEPIETPLVEITLFRRIAVTGMVIDQRTGRPLELFGIQARRIDDSRRGGRFGDFGRGRGRGGERGRGAREGRGGSGRRGEPGTPPRAGDRGRGGDPRPDGDRGEGERRRRERGGRGGDTGARGGLRANRDPEAERAAREARRQREEAYRIARLGPSGQAPRRTPEPTAHPGGTFIIEGLQPGEYVFDTEAPSYARIAAGPLELEKGQKSATLTIRLEPGTSIAGMVFDKKTRKPIAGARVELFLPPLEERAGNDFRRMFRGGRDNGIRVDDRRTDQDGKFSFASQRPGRFRLAASASDHVPFIQKSLILTAGREVTGMRIGLAAGGRVFGTVKNLEGDARVEVRHKDGNRASARVQKDGTYEIKGLEPGPYHINLDVSGGDFRRRGGSWFAQMNREPDVVLSEGGEVRFDLDAKQDKLCMVMGRVFQNGQPATGAEVTLQLQSQPAAGGQDEGMMRMARRISGRFLRDRTGDDGSFKISSVPPGSYRLEVRKGGRGGFGGRGGRGGSTLHRLDLILSEGQVFEQNFEIRTGVLELTVTDKEGKAVERARIELALQSEAAGKKPEEWRRLPSYRRSTARGGKVKVEDIHAGPWVWAVSGNGFSRKTGSVFVASDAAPASVSVQLEPVKKQEKKSTQGKAQNK